MPRSKVTRYRRHWKKTLGIDRFEKPIATESVLLGFGGKGSTRRLRARWCRLPPRVQSAFSISDPILFPKDANLKQYSLTTLSSNSSPGLRGMRFRLSSDRTVWSGGLLVYALEMVMLGFYFRDYLVANFAWIIAWIVIYPIFWPDFRAIVMTPVPIVPLLDSYMALPSFAGVWAYLIIWLGILGAIEYGQGDIRVWMAHAHPRLRASLKPFVVAQELTVKRGHPRKGFGVLAFGVSVGIALFIPILVAAFLSVSWILEISLLLGLLYLLLVREEIETGARRYEGRAKS